MHLLALENISFHYPDRRREDAILKHIDFLVKSGDCLRIVGRNGSGKTTFLKIIAGELRQTSGTRKVADGTSVLYMDQNAHEALAYDLTVEEQLFSISKKLSATKIFEKIGKFENGGLNILSKFGLGLENRLNEFVGQLSGGQKQIICLLSALNSGANILCLDEFTSAMDAQSEKATNRIISEIISKKQCAVILVSHKKLDLIKFEDLDLIKLGGQL